MPTLHHLKQSRGVVMIFLVLIIGSTSLAAAAVLARSSLGGLVDAYEQTQSVAVREKILGCLDETIIQLKKSDSFAPASISIGSATCGLAITTPAAGERDISLTLTEGAITRRLQANLTLSPFAVTEVTEN